MHLSYICMGDTERESDKSQRWGYTFSSGMSPTISYWHQSWWDTNLLKTPYTLPSWEFPGSPVVCCCSVVQLCPTLQPHGVQHVRLLRPSLSPGVGQVHVIELVMSSNHLIFCCSFHLLPSISPSYQGLFQWGGFFHQVAKVLELQLQHQSFQWVFRVDFL